MKRGIESLQNAVKQDAKDGENCFNPNGCDHEFEKIVYAPKYIKEQFGQTKMCKRVSKCSHKYCDKYQEVITKANEYSKLTGKSVEHILEIWEEDRTYWYMNYYAQHKIPMNITPEYHENNAKKYQEKVPVLSSLEDRLLELNNTIQRMENLGGMEAGLNILKPKYEKIKEQFKNLKSRVKFLELSFLICEKLKQ